MWKWTRQFGRQSGAGDYGDHVDDGARVLLVTGDEEYQSRWQKIFTLRGWQLSCTGTLAQAMNSMLTHAFPVVVYDCRPENQDWREALSALSEAPARPCVLLASNVIDENFKDEVVRLHGYDVFSRQADEDEIVRTINSAWFWKHRHA
jgi:ActR/RegA family two-component response regulator